MVEEDLLIPYTTQGAIGEIRGKYRVLAETFEAEGVILKIRAEKEEIQRIKDKYELGKKKRREY
ncbi:hypothetical protein D3C87_1898770 [compost metagenome]